MNEITKNTVDFSANIYPETNNPEYRWVVTTTQDFNDCVEIAYQEYEDKTWITKETLSCINKDAWAKLVHGVNHIFAGNI